MSEMSIEEAEALLRAAEKALAAAKEEANRIVASPQQAVREAEAALLAALIDKHPVKIGDVMDLPRWGGKVDRFRVVGFRRSYSRNLEIIGTLLKKDGTDSKITREYTWDAARLRKVAP